MEILLTGHEGTESKLYVTGHEGRDMEKYTSSAVRVKLISPANGILLFKFSSDVYVDK